jgi:hypothetical protein
VAEVVAVGGCAAALADRLGHVRVQLRDESRLPVTAIPSRLVRAEALAELGATLRRTGERVAALAPLREARELAHRCGATGLETRVHEELLIAGDRPRRMALSASMP